MELPDLNELDDIILTIEEENGHETECEIIAMFEYEDAAYAALTPTDESIAEVYLFGLEIEDQGDEMEFTLSNIEDEETLEEVGRLFESIMEEASEDMDFDDDSEAEADEDSEDAKWDEFINKKLDEIP